MPNPSDSGTTDLFRIKIGNTDRTAAEIVSEIRQHSALPIIRLAPAKDRNSLSGELELDMHLEQKMSPAQIKSDLEKYGGCMYQVITVEKIG